MFGFDEQIVHLGDGGTIFVALLVALMLGVRHAMDPDHLTALSTLVLSDDERGARRAGQLGCAWGAGHFVTLIVLGLPVVLFRRALPEPAQRAAEALIGLVIVILAVRLLLRWRRGCLHAHAHTHEHGVTHAHPHVHVKPVHPRDHERESHAHAHQEALGRTPWAAFGIGLLHGAGGSAGVGIVLVAGIGADVLATLALLLFALGAAISMTLVSAACGRMLVSSAVERRLNTLNPIFATASLAFGCWYAIGAFG